MKDNLPTVKELESQGFLSLSEICGKTGLAYSSLTKKIREEEASFECKQAISARNGKPTLMAKLDDVTRYAINNMTISPHRAKTEERKQAIDRFMFAFGVTQSFIES